MCTCECDRNRSIERRDTGPKGLGRIFAIADTISNQRWDDLGIGRDRCGEGQSGFGGKIGIVVDVTV